MFQLYTVPYAYGTVISAKDYILMGILKGHIDYMLYFVKL